MVIDINIEIKDQEKKQKAQNCERNNVRMKSIKCGIVLRQQDLKKRSYDHFNRYKKST